MSSNKNTVKEFGQNGLMFFCPGCNSYHQIRHGVNGNGWQWNNDLIKPTFKPSFLVKYDANPDAAEEFKEWRTARICHSFITDGQIQFLNDSTHALSGQTVELPKVDDHDD